MLRVVAVGVVVVIEGLGHAVECLACLEWSSSRWQAWGVKNKLLLLKQR